MQLRIVLYSAVAPSEMPVSASGMVANSNSDPDKGLDTVVNTAGGLAVDTDTNGTEA